MPLKQSGSLTYISILSMAAMPMLAEAHLDPERFTRTAFIQEPTIVDCSLEGGTKAQCYEFIVAYQPKGLEIGPFCPSNIDETGGIWDWDGDQARLYRLDRTFFEMLAKQGYRFYDKDGNIVIADPGSGQQIMPA